MTYESSNISSPGTETEASQTVRIQLDNLATIEVWAERRGEEVVDLKLHVHAPNGELYKEEHLKIEDGSTVEKAVAHGVDRAKRIAGGAFGVPDAGNSQATPI